MKIAGLIPARSGSTRIKDKNIAKLNGKPLLRYAAEEAVDSGVFDKVWVCTDEPSYLDSLDGLPVSFFDRSGTGDATAKSPDIEWLLNFIEYVGHATYDALAILRPTSPFRKAETIRRAMALFLDSKGIDSIRAVEEVSQHPGKMWIAKGTDLMYPVLPFSTEAGVDWHSTQKPGLPKVYIQNASLEIVYTEAVIRTRSLSGYVVRPFFTEGREGFDINEPLDLVVAEQLLSQGYLD